MSQCKHLLRFRRFVKLFIDLDRLFTNMAKNLVIRSKAKFFCRKLANTRSTKDLKASFAFTESLPTFATLFLAHGRYRIFSGHISMEKEAAHPDDNYAIPFTNNKRSATVPRTCCCGGQSVKIVETKLL